MTPPTFIRISVFQMSQGEFAALLGTSQSRVSDWESQGHIPAPMQLVVRSAGRDLCAVTGRTWNDSWFFEVPHDHG